MVWCVFNNSGVLFCGKIICNRFVMKSLCGILRMGVALWTAVLLMAIVAPCFAQNLVSVPKSEQSSVMEMIRQTASATRTIKADFVQTKTMQLLGSKMVSTGKMLYSQPSSFKWEYLAPYNYIFAITDGKVVMKSAQGKSEIEISRNRLFEEIASIMMGSVTGESFGESKDFSFSLFSSPDKKLYMAELLPVKKEIKQMFKSVRLFFLPDEKVVGRIVITDRSGDETVIELKNIVKNGEIAAGSFIVK